MERLLPIATCNQITSLSSVSHAKLNEGRSKCSHLVQWFATEFISRLLASLPVIVAVGSALDTYAVVELSWWVCPCVRSDNINCEVCVCSLYTRSQRPRSFFCIYKCEKHTTTYSAVYRVSKAISIMLKWSKSKSTKL